MKENKEKISVAAVQYATVESLNQEARIRTNADNQLRETIKILSNDYEEFKASGGNGGGVSKDYVDTQDALKQNINDTTLTTTTKTIVGAINENVTTITTKQNILITGTNIKTINNQSLLGTGNININRSGNTPLDNNIEIYDNENNNFVQYKATDLDWSKASDNSLISKNYVDQQDTTITNSVNLKANTTYVDTQDALKQNINDINLTTTDKTIVGAINENVTTINTKQNILIDTGDTQNIKTINNQSLLGTGNININTENTPLDNNIEIYDNENNNFVQYKATDLDWSKSSDNSLTSKSYVDQQDTTITNSVNLKADTTYVNLQDALKQNINDTNLTTTDKTIVGAINENVTTINTKQNILIDTGDTQNIKTINNQSLLGTGNIDICNDEVEPEPVAGWKNIDSNTFTKITGVTGKISSIDFTITSSTVSAFFAGSTAGKIYKSTNQEPFVAISTSPVTTGQTFSNLILDNQGYLYVSFKNIIGNLGGVYRTGSSTSTTLARYSAGPLSEPITGLFFNKATNDSYAAMEDDGILALYKWNSTPTATTPTILLNTPIRIGSYTDAILDADGNIYFVINNNDGRGSVFKYDVLNSSAPELLLTLSDTIIRSIAINNNVIYLAAENINTNTSIIYQSIDRQKFIKSGIKTDWTINQIIFDDQNHLYAGGINSNLYAAVINNNSIDNFSIISNQAFNNIYSLNYEQNVLVVGGQDEFSLAQVNNFDFTENN